jgi:cysteine desulfurase/selenocysteine lyase
MHAHDVAAFLNSRGIAVRAGNHCAQPLALKLGYTASVRISFYFYNTPNEVDFIIQSLHTMLSK